MAAEPQKILLPAAFDDLDIVFENHTGRNFRYTQHEAAWDPVKKKWRARILLYEDVPPKIRKYKPDGAA